MGNRESFEKMLLRTEVARLLVRDILSSRLDPPLSDPRPSSGIGASGKAHACPTVGFAAVGSGCPGPLPIGMIGGATRGPGGPLRMLEREPSGDMGPPLGRRRLAARDTCDVFALSYGEVGLLMWRPLKPWCIRLSTLLRLESIDAWLSRLPGSWKPWLIDGSWLHPECAELGIRADSGVLGMELRFGESSGLSNVDTCKPLFADVSVLHCQLSLVSDASSASRNITQPQC